MKANTGQNLLVMIHGWCRAPSDFNHQVEFFSSEFQIYRPDYSVWVSKAKNTKGNLFYWCAEQIKKEIMELKCENIIFAGHSMGGNMALHLASVFREQTRGVVMMDTSAPKTDAIVKKFNDFLAQLNNDDAEIILRHFIQNKWVNADYDDLPLMKKIENHICARWSEAPANFNKLLSDVFAFDSAKAVEQCAHPLLYIAGTPASGDIEKLKSLNSEIHISQLNSGHFVMLNQAAETNKLLRSFIENSR